MKQAWNEAMNSSGFINKRTDTEYSIIPDSENKIIYLSFEGSTSKLDWLQNLMFWKKPYKNMNHLFFVHRGIFNKYKSVQVNIFNILRPLLDENYALEIRGFSQGAGLAFFAHEDIGFHFPNVSIHTVAFASFKVFSFIGYKTLKKRFTNLDLIINVNDIVPKLPLLIQGYRHYGNKIKLGKWKLFVFPWEWKKEHMNYKDLF